MLGSFFRVAFVQRRRAWYNAFGSRHLGSACRASSSPAPSKSGATPVFVGQPGWTNVQGSSDGLATWQRPGNSDFYQAVVVQEKGGFEPSRCVRLCADRYDALRQPSGEVSLLYVFVAERLTGYRGNDRRRLRYDGIFRALQQVDFTVRQHGRGTIARDALRTRGEIR